MEDQQHAPMPACSLMGGWRWWVVGLYHEETAYLKPIVTVKVKVIITPNPDDPGVSLLMHIQKQNNVYNGNKQLKLIGMAAIHPGIKALELETALRESLNNTLPLHFHDQIPHNAATVPEVRQWLNLWFVENRKSSAAITKSIKRLHWDGNYLWSAGKCRIQTDLQSVGFSEAYSKVLARDIVAARARFDSQRWVDTLVTTIVGRCLLAAVLLTLLYFSYHRFLNQWE